MHSRSAICVALFAAARVAIVSCPACFGESDKASAEAPSQQQARKTVERSLEFLKSDAAKWRKEHTCSTCHHGTMTVWALSEAKSQGYAVEPEMLADMVKWTKERLAKIDEPRDTRDGWKIVNTPAVYLATMAQAVPKQDAVSADELKRIAGHLVRHQETNGAWEYSSAPAQNRQPPVFESDELVTRLAYMALGPHVPADAKEKSESREKAAAWLAKTERSDTTQADVVRLLFKVRTGEPAKSIQTEIERVLSLQNKDGGWSQLKDLSSDAYATGQALYVLSEAGVRNDRREIKRAAAFLLGNQKEDGSWPMIGRAHPGATPSKNQIPITYFGSAWGCLGLMRAV